jgi:hypothetical protein
MFLGACPQTPWVGFAEVCDALLLSSWKLSRMTLFLVPEGLPAGFFGEFGLLI